MERFVTCLRPHFQPALREQQGKTIATAEHWNGLNCVPRGRNLLVISNPDTSPPFQLCFDSWWTSGHSRRLQCSESSCKAL